MAKATLKEITKMMKKLDLCMLTTVDGRGIPDSRPMSNNRDVKFDGTSYFFSTSDTLMVRTIKKNANVNLSFIENKIFKKLFLVISGKASISSDKEVMKEHWNKDLEIWFKDGLDTKNLVLIAVEASFIKGWEKGKEFELDLKKKKK